MYSKIETTKNNDCIQHPSVRECLNYLKIKDGLEIHHDGDLPARSGIGSSSSFTVGLLHALYGLKARMVSPRKLAEDAIHVEQNLVGESVGIQDQIIAAYGGIKILNMGPGKNWNIDNLLLPQDYLKSLEDHILLGFSGISRYADQHASNKVKNIKSGKNLNELQAIYDIAKEAANAFYSNSNFENIGQLLNISWKHKRKLARGVSSGWMDDLYSTALKNGGVWRKAYGCWWRWVLFFIAPPSKHSKIKKALSKIKVWVPF